MARNPATRESGAGDTKYSRRPGEPFDESKVEDFARGRAAGSSIRVAAERAGVGVQQAKTWEQTPEIRERIRELRTGADMICTASNAWIAEQYKRIAERAIDAEKFSDATKALDSLREMLRTTEGLVPNMAAALGPPRSSVEDRDKIRLALSAPAQSQLDEITSDEPVEALQ